jgi:hypothetical protein
MAAPVLIVLGAQGLFTVSDFLARANMRKLGFRLRSFLQPWFAAYVPIRLVALAGQMYVISSVYIGRSGAMFGMSSLLLSNLLGLLVLREMPPPLVHLGVTLAAVGLILISIG